MSRSQSAQPGDELRVEVLEVGAQGGGVGGVRRGVRSKRGSDRKVRIVGHADASGSEQGNDALSLRRAESVVAYLVAKGADPRMLTMAGAGAKSLKNPKDPFSGENRRVEIGRQN